MMGKFKSPIGGKKGPSKPSFLKTKETRTFTDGEFQELRQFIYDKCGIFFQDNKKYLLENRLSGRLDALKLSSFQEYIKYLKRSPQGRNELNRLFDAITINETSFFRNEPQIQAFENVVFPEILDRAKKEGRNVIKIWSAACSSGEEPYTLAMVIHHKFKFQLGNIKVEIVGTDISQEIIEKANEGIYTEYSMRNMRPEYLSKYFQKVDGKYILNDDIKNMVIFEQANLLDRFKMSRYRNFDIIFCRNVLIYFDLKAKTQVINSLYDSLNPSGYLFIGHSESLHGISKAFKLVHFVKAMGYKKE